MKPLDPHQRNPIAHGNGPATVGAGRGAGRAHLIVERTIGLIEGEIAWPEKLSFHLHA